MTQEVLTQDQALRDIVGLGMDAALADAGLHRSRQGRTWRGADGELRHVVVLQKSGDKFDVQWSVICPQAVPVLWGESVDANAVQAGAITGRPADVRWPSAFAFTLGSKVRPERVQDLVERVTDDMRVLAALLGRLQTRAQLKDHLLASGAERGERAFAQPASRPLQLFTAAVLAVVDGSDDAEELVDAATEALNSLGPAQDDRVQRLRALADGRSVSG